MSQPRLTGMPEVYRQVRRASPSMTGSPGRNLRGSSGEFPHKGHLMILPSIPVNKSCRHVSSESNAINALNHDRGHPCPREEEIVANELARTAGRSIRLKLFRLPGGNLDSRQQPLGISQEQRGACRLRLTSASRHAFGRNDRGSLGLAMKASHAAPPVEEKLSMGGTAIDPWDTCSLSPAI